MCLIEIFVGFCDFQDRLCIIYFRYNQIIENIAFPPFQALEKISLQPAKNIVKVVRRFVCASSTRRPLYVMLI